MSAEFDAVVGCYHAQHTASTKLSGEEPDFFARYKVEATAEAVSKRGLTPQRILDFGSGIGNSLPHLQATFPKAEVTCLDVSERSLDECSKRALRPAKLVGYDGSTIPLRDGSFDLVFTACVFHHIEPRQHIDLLAQIRRKLSRYGKFMLFEHNPWNPLTRHAVNICPFDENAILISGPEMRRRLHAAGFSDVRLAYRMFFPAALSALRGLERHLSALPLGAQYSLLAN